MNYTEETFPYNNWYMQFTEEERSVVDNWRINIVKYSINPCPGNYINWGGAAGGDVEGRFCVVLLITFQDFQKFVLKEQEEIVIQDYDYLIKVLKKYNIR
jgi:hypothetical protein